MSTTARTRTPSPPPAAERDRVLRTLREHEAEIRALGVAHLGLFGSMARGEAGPESDVDIAIDVPPGQMFSLLDLAEARLTLCDILGRDVDVVILQDLRPRFRSEITHELVEVFDGAGARRRPAAPRSRRSVPLTFCPRRQACWRVAPRRFRTGAAEPFHRRLAASYTM